MSLTRLIDQYPNQLLCSLLLALLAVLGGTLHLHQSRLHQSGQLALVGENLARQAARQLADPALLEDPVSLQVLLSELVQSSPLVVGAAVHDVEGQLRVQSGQLQDSVATHRHGAPIRLQEHQAGTLWLNLTPPINGQRRALFWLWFLAAGLLMLAPWLVLLQQYQKARREQHAIDDLAAELSEEPLTPGAAVRLSLHLSNLGRLYNQLNSAGFSQLMDGFEEQLRSVLSLYGGRRQLLWDQVLIVDFQGEETADCCFRAICASQLLFNLHARQGSPRLQLGATVQGLPTPESVHGVEAEFLAQYSERRLPEPGDILIAARLLDSRLQQYVQTEEHTGLLTAVRPPYCDMLKKQELRLSEV